MSAEQNVLPITIPSDSISDRTLLLIPDSINSISSDYQLAFIQYYAETAHHAYDKLWNGDLHHNIVLIESTRPDYTELLKRSVEHSLTVINYSNKSKPGTKEFTPRLQVDDYLNGSINHNFIKPVDLLTRH